MRLSATCLLITLATPAFLGGFAAQAEEPPQHKPHAEASTPPQTPAELRSEIYSRLAASKDSDETEGLVGLLLTSYAQSGSDTGDLLISRAHKAMKAKDFDDAGKILDATIALLPNWAEGWNARATLRYLDDDYDGSMADIAETLKREPRHLGALLGMATILDSRDKKDAALKVYQRVLAIAPHWKSAEEAANKLKGKVAGQDL